MIKNFLWVIENFSSLQDEHRYSRPVVIGDFEWRLHAYLKGHKRDSLSLSLEVVNYESLPWGSSVCADYSLTFVNQISKEHNYKIIEKLSYFERKAPSSGQSIPLTYFNYIYDECLMSDELVILAEVEVIELIGTLNASQVDEPDWTALDYSSSSKEDEDEVTEFNGFQIHESQVNQVKEIFEKHPDFASNFDLKSQGLKNDYMDYLLELIETLSKSANELTEEDLKEADNTLSDLTRAGFKLDWLRMKLDQASKQKACDTSNVIVRLRSLCRNFIN